MGEHERRPGSIVGGRFTLVRELGTGGFGHVWLARDQQLGREVALKLLHAHLGEHAQAVARFTREAEILARLDHPNIARALGAGEVEGTLFLAVEYVDGAPLSREIARRALVGEPFALAEIATVVRALGSALDHAHALGIVHRDLKPANVMLTRDGRGAIGAKVLDFGIAKVLGQPSGDATTVGRLLGSWLYMSPEQVQGAEIDARTDTFALGAITFEMLTLRKAFARDEQNRPLLAASSPAFGEGANSRFTLLRRIVIEARPLPSNSRPELSPDVDRVVTRALDPEPDARFQSGVELARALEAALAASTETTSAKLRAAPARAETLAPEDLAAADGTPFAATRAPVLSPTKAVEAPRAMALEPIVAREEVTPSEVVERALAATAVARPKKRSEPSAAESAPAPAMGAPTNSSGSGLGRVAGLVAAGFVVALLGTMIVVLQLRRGETLSAPADAGIEVSAGPVASPRAAARASDIAEPAREDVAVAEPTEAMERPSAETTESASAKTSKNAKSGAFAREPKSSAKSAGEGASTTEGKSTDAKSAKPASVYAELDRELAHLRAGPTDLERVGRFADRLRAEAERVPDEGAKTSIKRCVAASAMRAEIGELAECLAALHRARGE